MSQFRQLSRRLIQEAENLCHELMYGLEPTVDLESIKDDTTNKQLGYSFVSDPANNLHEAYLELSRQACMVAHGSLSHKGGWKWKAVDQDLRTESRFRLVLGLVMQETGGQAARWAELLSLLCENSEYGQRGSFAFKSYIIYIIRHHKANRSTNREFIVARFLPVAPSRILYKYVVYIRPFVDLLQREHHRAGLAPALEITGRSQLLFRKHSGPGSKAWSTEHFNDAIKRETQNLCGQSVNSRIMRQLRIGITEKHVREVYKPFNRYDDKGPNASRNAIFAHQSGHRPRQRGTNYGLDGAFPTKLQPQLLELYEWASTRWHEFLHLPSKLVQDPPSASSDGTASHEYVVDACAPEPVISGATAGPFAISGDLTTQSGLGVKPPGVMRRASVSCIQQPAAIEGPRARLASPSSAAPHQMQTFPECATSPAPTNDSYAGSPPLSLQSFSYGTNGCDDCQTHFHASPAGETASIGLEVALAPLPAHDTDKSPHLILGRDLVAVHDSEEEMKSFNIFLHEYITQRQSGRLMHERLRRVIETTRWWRSNGCPLCFLCENTKAERTLRTCKRNALRNKALSMIRWLEDLRIPRYTSQTAGACSLCLSFYACGEADAVSRGHDNLYTDSDCETKPIMCMAIACLAAYYAQLF